MHNNIVSRAGNPYVELSEHVCITANGVWYWQPTVRGYHSAPDYYDQYSRYFLAEGI